MRVNLNLEAEAPIDVYSSRLLYYIVLLKKMATLTTETGTVFFFARRAYVEPLFCAPPVDLYQVLFLMDFLS